MENVLTQIGIIGAGELGRAIGGALTKAQTQVLYYDRDATRSTTGSLEDLVATCEVLLVCVPSWAVRDIAKQIKRAANPTQPRVVVTFAKGVEAGFVTMDQVLKERLPAEYDSGVIYGPMVAAEIDRGKSSYGVVALSNTRLLTLLRNHFAAANIYLDTSGDARGVALCAVLKNVYAIGFGIIDGLSLGLNAKGKMAVLVLSEMKRVLTTLHANPQTAEGIAGLGDLLATGYSIESFNYRIGKSLAEGIADEHIKSEGLVTLHELSKHIQTKHFPVLHTLDQIIFHYGNPHTLAELLAS